MSGHIVNYDETTDGTKSQAVCSCGDKSPMLRGSATETWPKLDQWAEQHIEAKS